MSLPNTRWRTPLFHSVAAVILLAACGAQAASEPTEPIEPGGSDPTAQASQIDDIVVTANRRETRLIETPLAVNAVTSEALTERGFRRLNDLAGYAAGVNIPNQSFGTQAIFIRGIGTTRPIGNPSVGIYIDDVYIPRSFGTGWYGSLPDIARVEILHGPQGTLYGQNSSAGAVKLVSQDPSDERRAWAEVGVGNLDLREVRAYVAGPIADTLSASLAVSSLRQDGPDENVTLGRKVGALAGDQARAILRWQPNDRLDVKLSADYLRDRSEYRTASPIGVVGGGVRRTFSDIDPQQTYDGGGVTLRAKYALTNAISVQSITAWRTFDMELPTDTDGVATYVSGFVQRLNQHQLSQELQLTGDFGRLNLTAGALAYKESFDVWRHSWTNNVFSILQSQSETTSYGLYAQGDYRITDKLTATLGLRTSYETKDMDAQGWRSNVAQAVLAQTFDVEGLSKDYHSTTPRVGLSYRFTPHVLAYASYAQGTTSGGFNSAPGNAAVAAIPIGQEKVSAYETGAKGSFFDGRLQGSIALFYNDYEGYQASITNPIIGGVPVTGAVIQNAGDAHIYGAEFELTARPTDRLDLGLSLASMRSAFDSYENPTGAEASDYVGQALPFVPEFTAGLRIGYVIPFANGSDIRLNAGARYETESYSTIATTREDTKFPEQTYVDAGVAYTTPDRRWTLSLSAKNLFAETYALPVSGAYAPAQGLNGVGYNMPRTVALRLRYQL